MFEFGDTQSWIDQCIELLVGAQTIHQVHNAEIDLVSVNTSRSNLVDGRLDYFPRGGSRSVQDNARLRALPREAREGEWGLDHPGHCSEADHPGDRKGTSNLRFIPYPRDTAASSTEPQTFEKTSTVNHPTKTGTQNPPVVLITGALTSWPRHRDGICHGRTPGSSSPAAAR